MSKDTSKSPLVLAMQDELSSASPALTDNPDLLRGILSGCGDCIKVLDLDGRLLFMSEGGKRVMEVDDFSKLKGCPWPDFWEGQGNKDAAAAVQAAVRGKTGRFRGPANTAKGHPRYWDVQVSPIFGTDGNPSHLLSISRDITEEWKASERQQFLTRELQHRVKNTLANVISIANQTFKGDANREERIAFNARLVTLDRAHDVLTDTNWGNTDIRKIVTTALVPHAFENQSVHIEGPSIEFGPKQALALALAVNELATNAVKYGALKANGGRIDIAWTETYVDGRKMFQWRWQESGGPPVKPPSRSGFGSRVIKDLLIDELGGVCEMIYEPAGLVCALTTPVENLAASEPMR